MEDTLTVKPALATRPHLLAALWLAVAGAAIVLALADAKFGWLHSSFPASISNASLVLLLLALGCEFMDSTIGMGYGTTLTPVLLILGYPVTVIVPAAVLSQFIGNLSSAFFHHQAGNVDFLRDHKARNTALIMGTVGMVVSVLSVLVAVRLPQDVLRTMVAAIVAVLGVFLLISTRLKFEFRWRNIGILAGLAAFNKSFSGGGYGPLVCGGQVLAGLSVRKAVATTALAEAIVCVVTVVTYWATGATLPLAVVLPLVAGSVLSTPLSAVTLRRLPTSLVRRLMGVAVLALGVLALLKVTRGI